MYTADGGTETDHDRVLTYAQLHELACIVCSAEDDLVPAGHRTVDGLPWAIVACAEHAASAR